jgi:hypothetical protein
MVNERDKCIGAEDEIVVSVKEKDVFVRQTLSYIKKYQITYKKAISEARKRKLQLFQGQ